MNRQEIIQESQLLETQINDLKNFLSILKTQDTTHPIHWNGLKSCIKKKSILSFLGIWSYTCQKEIIIPEFMRIEIAAKCELWIEELEKQANKLLGV